ncbi:MAG: hypothetical protein KAR42_16880 [candidate division Zixibacteria bacterium]|nr:hypothetical protein [candidate division Zixibacteria bacterium]
MKKKLIFGLIFLLLAFGALEAQYHFFLKANRYWSNTGVFSTDGPVRSIGTDNALRLGYTPSRYIEMVCNDDGELEFDVEITRAGENFSTMQFWTEWANADECRKGVINIFASRDTVISSPGGSPDMGMQIYVRNNATNLPVTVGETTSYHNLRGLESIASNKDSGARTADVVAGYFSAESRSGTTSTRIIGMHVLYDQSGGTNTSNMGIFVQCNSQSDVGTSYGINLNATNYNQVREYGYFLDSLNGSWTNGMSFNGTVTNAFDFENTNGTNAAGFNASYSTTGAGAVDGYIKVDVGGNTLYIYLWPTIPT